MIKVGVRRRHFHDAEGRRLAELSHDDIDVDSAKSACLKGRGAEAIKRWRSVKTWWGPAGLSKVEGVA